MLVIWDFNNTLYNRSEKALYTDTVSVLEKFHGNTHQVLYSTGFLKSGREKLIKEQGIWSFFDEVIIGFKTVKRFQSLQEKYCVSPKRTYVIGDRLDNEIRIGEKLGMKTIWVARKSPGRLKKRLFRLSYWKKAQSLREAGTIVGICN